MDMSPLLLDSITDLGPDTAGRVAVSGSHGGLYPGALASRGGLWGVIFNDAGGGLEGAGVAGVMAADDHGMAAAAADCMTCRIGSAGDMMAGGVISYANRSAMALGIAPGMSVAQAAALLVAGATAPTGQAAKVEEARRETALPGGAAALLVDSASLVGPEDAGRIIVTGSHGGLIGGDPARALKTAARIAAFNDAGFGKQAIGATRLPALEARGVAAVTVSHDSARIGDAQSALMTGIISAANPRARTLGLIEDRGLKDALADLG